MIIWPQVSTQQEDPAAWFSVDSFHDAVTERELQQCSAMTNLRRWSRSSTKRVFDILFSLLVLLLFSIPGLLIALLVRVTSEGPAIFAQNRVGRGGRLFKIYKFRTMRMVSGSALGTTLTRTGDHRITPLGLWLRKLKLDELPQFYNVLCGDMSLIGPRPKLPQYCDVLEQTYRPGITGAATLAFRREEELMRHVPESGLDAFYNARIKPLKTLIDVRYMARATFLSDTGLILATFITCLAPAQFSKRMTSAFLSNIPLDRVDHIESEAKPRPSIAVPARSESADETVEVA